MIVSAGTPADKVCARCKDRKKAAQFYKSTITKSGLTSYCISCHRMSCQGLLVRACPLTKQCPTCKEIKTTWEFGRRKAGRYLRSSCKKCDVASHMRLHVKQRPLRLRNFRDRALRAKYGMTEADYDAMLAAQGGCCAICHTTRPGGGPKRNFAVDHNHETGAVRGLLCNGCNRALGYFYDRLDVVLAAADYLRVHQAK